MSSPARADEMKRVRKNMGRRPRAASACIDCRRRKVRCDVMLRHPCSNCQFDEYDCQVIARRPKQRGSHGECTQQDSEPKATPSAPCVENYFESSSENRAASDTEIKQETSSKSKQTMPAQAREHLGSFNDYVSIMATEMTFLENNGFLAAAAVVVVLQETTVQRLLVRQKDPVTRDEAIVRLRRCRDTIEQLRSRQISMGCGAEHLSRVLKEIQNDIQHFDRNDSISQAQPLYHLTLPPSPLSCGLPVQENFPDQPARSQNLEDLLSLQNYGLGLGKINPAMVDQAFVSVAGAIPDTQSCPTSTTYSTAGSPCNDDFADWMQLLATPLNDPSSAFRPSI